MMESFALAYPSALLLLPAAIAGLVYIYRKKGDSVRRTISSALFVRMLKQKKAKRTRFKPPLRFLVELLLFSLLALGAAQLLLDSQKQHLVVLLDNSLSMATLDVGVAPAQTRLEKAKEQARNVLSSRNYFIEVTVWRTTPILEPIHPGTLSVAQALDQIDSVSQGYGPDRIEQAIQRVMQLQDAGEVFVYTDKVPEAAPEEGMSIKTIRDERRAQNVSLSKLTRSNGERPGRQNVAVTVTAYTTREIAVDIVVSRLKLVAAKIDEQKIRQFRVELGVGEEREVPFENLEEGSSYKFEIVPVDESLDMLREDNAAWIVGGKKSDVIGYVGDVDPRSLGLTQAGNLRVVPLHELTSKPLFSVFYGAEIPDEYDGNALSVMPPGEALVRESKLSVYDETHPLTSYISFPALSLSAVRPLGVPSWAKSIIETTAGTILYAGINEGRKQVVYGYDPFPYAGKRAPLRSILILNTFKWLSEKNVALQASAPGIKLRDEGSQLYYGDQTPLLKVEDSYVANRTGIVHTATTIVDAVNFFDPLESNPTPSTFAVPVAREASSSEDGVSGVPLTRMLALLLLGLLLLDIFLFEVRKKAL